MRNLIFRAGVYSFIVTFLAIFLSTTLASHHASALSGSGFKAGNIISDGIFFDGYTMNASTIQSFLNAKVPTCDTNGTQPSGHPGYSTRASWGAANGASAPYVCLKNLRVNTQSRPSEAGLCSGYTGAANQSAADIIYNVSISCGINPKVLIVLLQKEQSLITDDWPWPVQYQSATGMGCPDTADCDSQYNGFFYQTYYAARQFKLYARDSGSYNHTAGFTNNVRYNPNASCGSSSVYITNQATAGLYNYTPYQPNTAALNNLYGTGDGCSAYGNRNFWRMFNDWFGSTEGGSYLLRTVDNGTVYMVVDNVKYPISDINLLSAYQTLGPIGYVSQGYLNSKTTGHTLGRLIRSPNGTIYFVDASIKLAFTSCGLVAHYGYDCSAASYVNMTDSQLSLLVNGPNMTRVLGMSSGKIFYMESANKREVYDKQTLQNNAIPLSYNVLGDHALDYLQYGAPMVRDNVVISQRGSTNKYLYYLNVARSLDNNLYSQTSLKNLPNRSFDLQSLQKLSQQEFNGFISNNSASSFYMLTAQGKVQLSDSTRWSTTYTALPDSLFNMFTTTSSQINNGLIKTASNGTVYYAVNKQKRPIASWDDVMKINSNPVINTISDYYSNKLTTGVRIVGPSKLVKYLDNGTVYMIDGFDKKIPLTTFLGAIDMGLNTNVVPVSDNVLNSYTTTTPQLNSKINCGVKNYFASSGGLYEVSSTMQTQYQLTYRTLDAQTCTNLILKTTQMTRFIRTPNGTIYYIEGGTKKPFSGYNTYITYGGTGTNTVAVSDYGASQIPTGPAAQ